MATPNPKKKDSLTKATSLRAIRPMVAGLDVGSKEHWVCGPAHLEPSQRVHVFGTTTDQLVALAEWLVAHKVESVAMESTYVYWIPIYELLESKGIEVVLVNARQFHNVPGRKTDFSDCQWLQQLHSCGLLRGSFRPGEAITKLRAMQRQIGNLVAERTRCIQWMQKALDQMNVQVHRAVTDITGQTGMAIVRAIVGGERDPERLAGLRHGRCRKSVREIARYLTGTWREEHLFNLASALRLFDAIEGEVVVYQTRVNDEIVAIQPPERQKDPVPSHPNPLKERAIRSRHEQEARTTLWRFSGIDLTRIDGISTGIAQIVLTEVGPDLTAFPSEGHFISWLRLCPRTPISGGKPLKKRLNGLGANRISGALRTAVTSMQRFKTALGASFRRIARRKGGAVAVFATARQLARLIYRMLRFGHDYVDIGEAAYEKRFETRKLAALTESARSLGYRLVPDPIPDLAPA